MLFRNERLYRLAETVDAVRAPSVRCADVRKCGAVRRNVVEDWWESPYVFRPDHSDTARLGKNLTQLRDVPKHVPRVIYKRVTTEKVSVVSVAIEQIPYDAFTGAVVLVRLVVTRSKADLTPLNQSEHRRPVIRVLVDEGLEVIDFMEKTSVSRVREASVE